MNYTYVHLQTAIKISELRILFSEVINEHIGNNVAIAFKGHHCQANTAGPKNQPTIVLRCAMDTNRKISVAHSTYLNMPSGVEYWLRERIMHALIARHGGYLTDDGAPGRFQPEDFPIYDDWCQYRTRNMPKILKMTISRCSDAHSTVREYVIARDAQLKKVTNKAEHRKEA